MRLMLGTKGNPSLLVAVEQERSPADFDFWVVNGAWSGVFNDGHMTVLGCPTGDFSSLDHVEILTDNQDRLRGEYQNVFNNFSNPEYVAPAAKIVDFSDMDDDIPF